MQCTICTSAESCGGSCAAALSRKDRAGTLRAQHKLAEERKRRDAETKEADAAREKERAARRASDERERRERRQRDECAALSRRPSGCSYPFGHALLLSDCIPAEPLPGAGQGAAEGGEAARARAGGCAGEGARAP